MIPPAKPPVVRREADRLTRAVREKFPTLQVEYVALETAAGWRRAGLLIPNAWEFDLGADGYLWIRGERRLAEKAREFAQDMSWASWDRTGVSIEVQMTSCVWCSESRRRPRFWDPDDDWLEEKTTVAYDNKSGLTFLCWVKEPHDHHFEELQNRFLKVKPNGNETR